MSSIRTDPVALDTNEYVLGIRRSREVPTCATLLFEFLPKLRICVPLRVIVELHRVLLPLEQQAVYDVLATSSGVLWDYAPPPRELVTQYESLGAKKGDAVIAAHLHEAGIKWLISENRHFLKEIKDLPFSVLTSAEAIEVLS